MTGWEQLKLAQVLAEAMGKALDAVAAYGLKESTHSY
jgi:hypothetical protein